MNYFEHHIGDYAESTMHLTFVEDAAYHRLMRKYYAKEKPIPADLKDAQRLVGARTKEERCAVETVLKEFFFLEQDGWHQKKCDEVIEKYLSGEPEREIKKVNEDNRLKRHREERAKLFKIITDAGEHAPWNIGTKELRDLANRIQNGAPATADETTPATPPDTALATPATATQYPLTNTQSPLVSSSLRSEDSAAKTQRASSRPKREEVTLAKFLETCKAAGVKPVPDNHPIRAWCEDAKIPGDMVQIAWVVFREKYLGDEKLKNKRYKDWASHFATSVKDRWYGLWFVGEDGAPQWTATGLQRKQVLDAKANREAA